MPRTHAILVLAYPGAQILDITGPGQMFAGANDALGYQAYRVHVAASKAGPFETSSGIQLVADTALGKVGDQQLSNIDTVIAVGGSTGSEAALDAGEITRLLTKAAGRVPRIAAVCTGAFFLAAAGLLDGRRAATHWQSVERLRRFRPQVQVDGDAIHVRDGNVWTSAGVTAGIDLTLAMIEADYGKSIALEIAQRHVVFRIRPGGQSQFSSELAAQGVSDTKLAKLTEKIATSPRTDWSIETLAEEASVSLRTLTRLFRKDLNVSPAEFVERVRMDQARCALVETDAPLSVIALQSGFGSLRRMDRAFARVMGTTPSDFRARFKSHGVTT